MSHDAPGSHPSESAGRFRWKSGLAIVAAGLVAQGVNYVAWGEDTTFRTFTAIYLLLTTTAFALVLWWAFFCGLARSDRGWGLAGLIVAVGVFLALFRIEGVDGVMVPYGDWRWKPSREAIARAFRVRQPVPPPPSSSSGESPKSNGDGEAQPEASPAEARVEIGEEDWPRFRGPASDGIVRGVTLRTDWDANPPRELWKQPCGLGWSSFAVVGGRLYTQEQHDADEAVVCYDADTGRPLWRHTDPARLSTSLGGDGPRATPTLYDSRIYTLGGTGLLNCLDAATGRRLWSADINRDAGIDSIGDNTLDWGFAGSPCVDERLVYVNPGKSRSVLKGPEASVAAYDRLTGKRVWASGSLRAGYATPLLAELDGARQLVIFGADVCAGFDPDTGRALWRIPWANNQGINVAQPIPVGARSLVISSGYAAGSLRFDVLRDGDQWTTEERWKLVNQFKLKFNDGVLREGVIYGLDEGILACLDVETGKRVWREGRYRYGEIVLIAGETPADDLLVVLTETGDVVLVHPSREKPRELGRFKAIDGTCWNHPVVHRGRVYVRSERQMACFEIGR